MKYLIIKIISFFYKNKWGFKKTKAVKCDIHPQAIIKIPEKKLILGATWSEKDIFPSLLVIREKASLLVKNKFRIYSGAKMYINKNVTLILGSGYINHNLNLSCFHKIEIGEQVAISENVTIRDSDNHQIGTTLEKDNLAQPVKIGDKVWIGLNVTILKGVTIGDGAVIAAGSLVNKNVPSKCLVAGVPAKVIKENIEWN